LLHDPNQFGNSTQERRHLVTKRFFKPSLNLLLQALDIAFRRFEHGISACHHSLDVAILASESLYFDLKRMEMAYLENDSESMRSLKMFQFLESKVDVKKLVVRSTSAAKAAKCATTAAKCAAAAVK
jgi:hypothetical protein